MEIIKSIFEWAKNHPGEITAAAIAIYPVLDTVLRRFIPEATVARWEQQGGTVLQAAAKIYRILTPFFVKNK